MYSTKLITLNGQKRIAVYFENKTELITRFKKLRGAQWSSTLKVWHLPDTTVYRKRFKITPATISKEVLQKIDTVNQPAMQKMLEELLLKGYSENTLKTYRNEFAQLLYSLKNKSVDSLDSYKIRGYFLYCINKLKMTENQIHSRFNAVKFYF